MFNILRVSWSHDDAHHGANATVEIRLDDLRVLHRLREAYTRGGFTTQVSRCACPCCGSFDVTLESNAIARWVQCHYRRCGLTHHVATNPELEQYFA